MAFLPGRGVVRRRDPARRLGPHREVVDVRVVLLIELRSRRRGEDRHVPRGSLPPARGRRARGAEAAAIARTTSRRSRRSSRGATVDRFGSGDVVAAEPASSTCSARPTGLATSASSRTRSRRLAALAVRRHDQRRRLRAATRATPIPPGRTPPRRSPHRSSPQIDVATELASSTRAGVALAASSRSMHSSAVLVVAHFDATGMATSPRPQCRLRESRDADRQDEEVRARIER